MEASDNVKAVQSGDLLESESECRKQFEEVYHDFNKYGRNPDGTYGDWNLELTWKCWDAAWHCALNSKLSLPTNNEVN